MERKHHNYKLIFERMKEAGVDVPVVTEEISEDDAVIAFERLSKF